MSTPALAAYTQIREQIARDLDDAGDQPANMEVYRGTQDLIDGWTAVANDDATMVFAPDEIEAAVRLVNRDLGLELEAY